MVDHPCLSSSVGRESRSWYAALDLCKKINSVVKLQEEGDRGQACAGKQVGAVLIALRFRGVDMKAVATVIQVTVRNGKVVLGRTRDLVKIGTCRFGSRSPCQGKFSPREFLS